MLNQIRFADPGRPDQDHVLLCIFGFFRARRVLLLELAEEIDVVVMIAHRDGENLLRFILLDHEAIEVRLDVARQKIENELLALFSLRLLLGPGFHHFRLGVGRERNLVAEVRFHELGQLGFQFFR